MTVGNVFLDAHGAHLMTDGAATSGPRGRVLAWQNKAWSYPHLRAAFVVSGPGPVAQMIDGDIRVAPIDTPEKLIAEIPQILRVAVTRVTEISPDFAPDSFLTLVAWPEGSAHGVAYVCYSVDVPGFAKPYQMRPLHGDGVPPLAFMSHSSPAIDAELRAAGMPLGAATATPLREGVALMRAQRRHEPSRNIGGFCQVTTVKPSGVIISAILERWPDRLGEPIQGQEAA